MLEDGFQGFVGLGVHFVSFGELRRNDVDRAGDQVGIGAAEGVDDAQFANFVFENVQCLFLW